jgi:hypothetical protein
MKFLTGRAKSQGIKPWKGTAEKDNALPKMVNV